MILLKQLIEWVQKIIIMLIIIILASSIIEHVKIKVLFEKKEKEIQMWVNE
jgi:hypothetical protein